MASKHDSIHPVLPHAGWCSPFRLGFCHDLAHGDVEPLEVTPLATRHQQEVEWQKVHDQRLCVITHAVQLYSLMIIDVQVLALSDGKHVVVL